MDKGIAVSRQYVCEVLRKDIGARFKPIKKIPFLGNSKRCLLLRQHYARFMIDQLQTKCRIINVDQTWIGDTNYTRRRWRFRNQVNTVCDKRVNPRISMLMAISTEGRLYCALTQVNTDHDVFCLFISMLAKKLTSEDRNWKGNTLLLCDGARYQTCSESIRHMKAQGFLVCITAPYSYASSPIEYAFAFFKSVNLNPNQEKTGKR